MLRSMLICCAILAGCADRPAELVPVAVPVPDILLEPIARPDRPLVTYKDAVLRDHERGVVIDQLNAKIIAIGRIVKSQNETD